MTVQTSSSKVVWLGNGATTIFSYSFEIDLATYVVLTYTDVYGNVTTLSTSSWAISGLGNPYGGTITYPLVGTPIAAGATLTLQRVVPFTQPTNLSNQGGMWPAVVMGADDNQEYQIQQLAEQVSRAILVSVSETQVAPLPPAAARAGMNLTFNSVGAPIASLPATSTVAISAVMVPVVEAVSIAAAETLLRAPYGEIWLTDFAGADPTGVGYNDVPWAAFVAAVMSSGRRGFVPPGRYLFAAQATMDFGLAAVGAGSAKFAGILNRSILDFSTVAMTATPALQITDTVGGLAAFYGVIDGISVRANCPGPAVAIGKTSHADAFNGFTFNMVINNYSTSASVVGLQVNGAYNCTFDCTVNNSGLLGDSLQLTECAFSTFFGSYSGANVGMHLTSFYVFGNVFMTPDLEVVNTCVVIDVASCSNNTWLGGQFVWNVAAINATAGGNNRFIGGNFSSRGTLPVTSGSVGVIVYGAGTASNTETMGGLLIQVSSGDASIELAAPPTNGAYVYYQENVSGVDTSLWFMGKNNATMTGGNVGADFQISRLSDIGVVIDNPLSITRSNGVTSITHAAMGVGTGGTLSFYGASLATKPTVTGAKGGNAALTSLMTTLATLGLVVDSTS